MLVKGRIVNYIRKRDKNGEALFIFTSDASNGYKRFTALCKGKVPDVVPAVPMLMEFAAESISQIRKIDFKEYRAYVSGKKGVDVGIANQLLNAAINFNDENYAESILISVKGISKLTARRILTAVNGDICKLSGLWDNAEFWKNLKGSKRYLPALKEKVEVMLGKEKLYRDYSRYGIGYPQIDILFTLYGAEAENRLRENPYMALDKLDLDFQVADNLARDIGFSYLDHKRICAMVCHVLRKNEQQGNTCMYYRNFFKACAQMHSKSAWPQDIVSPFYILTVVSKMNGVYIRDGYFGFMSTLLMETRIAYKLQELRNAPSDLCSDDAEFLRLNDTYNADQIKFLQTFDKSSVTLLLGRGGTGKTHTICGAINLFKKRYPDGIIKLCAPTARAAGVLKERTGHNSSTIHVMLGITPSTYGQEDVQPLDAQMVVVDEMSMVDTKLMSYLLYAIKPGTKLILCGDPDQLESVGCGSVLRDIIKANVVPAVVLHQVMRQHEGSAIIENCDRILDGVYRMAENQHFHFRQCVTDQEAFAYLKSCYYGDSHNVQILTTTRKGPVGSVALNEIFKDDAQEGIWLNNVHYKTGDKVIFTRNNYSAGYCNGDIGFVKEATNPIMIWKQGEGKIITVSQEDSSDLEHADAITIHKSQGSEYRKTYIILPEDPITLLTRNMINTAISRAREDVELIVVGNALRIAASNVQKKERTTMLGVLLNVEDAEYTSLPQEAAGTAEEPVDTQNGGRSIYVPNIANSNG